MAAASTYRRGVGGQLDPHARAAFRRAGLDIASTYATGRGSSISGHTILAALDKLCRGLKKSVVDGSDLWSRFSFIYPFIGSAPGAACVNLLGNLDGGLLGGAAFDFNGQGLSLAGSGAIDTGFAPAHALPDDSNHLSVYLTEDPRPNEIQVDLGTVGNMVSTGQSGYFDLLTSLNGTAYFENSAGGMLPAATPGPLGWTCGTRTATNLASLYKNGQLLGATAQASEGYPAYNPSIGVATVYLFQRPTQGFSSYRRFAFASGGLGLSAAQQQAVYQLVQQFQTALHRQV